MRTFLVVSVCLVFGITINALAQKERKNERKGNSASSIQIRQEGIFFTAPLIDCENISKKYNPLALDIQKIIEERTKKGLINRASVYVKNLSDCSSFGVNENQKYSPASLLKVADMIYVLKQAEIDRSILKDQVLYDTPRIPYDSLHGTPTSLQIGEYYKISKLLTKMIVNSDNEPIDLLEQYFDKNDLWRYTFEQMGISVRLAAGVTKILSPKQYSTLFTSLYNSSFLNREMSGVALDLLCNTTFTDGIVTGIGDGTLKIASKYGIRVRPNSLQLHETAIVYARNTPYVISIMSEGRSYEHLTALIQDISRTVHQQIQFGLGSVSSSSSNITRSQTNTDPMIAPLLDCSTKLNNKNPLSIRLNKYIEEQVNNKAITSASIYFEDLSTSTWLGINQNERYIPASLIKMPILLSTLRESEMNTDLLKMRLRCTNPVSNAEPFIADKQIEFGEEYSVLELLEYMILYSDNLAANLLFDNIENPFKVFESLFDELKINQWTHPSDKREALISPKDMSMLFKVLYNSTYLNRDNSELALGLLQQSKFQNGIRKGIDNGTTAALKFGERTIYHPILGKTCYLHDCGIVYFEERPYLICIMTKGESMEKQAKTIAGISRLVFDEVKEQSVGN